MSVVVTSDGGEVVGGGGSFSGHHTKVVQLGPRYGFIVSEVMFLFALFRASSHSSLAPTARRAILVRKEKRANSVIQDILILELMLSSGEEVFIERGKSRVASRLTDFSKSEEYLSFDHPEHEGAALDVRSTVKERRKGPCSFSPCSDDALLARGATYLLREGRKPMELDFIARLFAREQSLTGKPGKPDHSILFTLAQSLKLIWKLWNRSKARRTNLDSKHWAGDREDGLWIDFCWQGIRAITYGLCGLLRNYPMNVA
ncbi:cytochrome c oxidase subunit 3 [Tanacetum coccineum]